MPIEAGLALGHEQAQRARAAVIDAAGEGNLVIDIDDQSCAIDKQLHFQRSVRRQNVTLRSSIKGGFVVVMLNCGDQRSSTTLFLAGSSRTW